jgi:hypothetical protein
MTYPERRTKYRLEDINTFVHKFRGWQDDAEKLSDEVKVINVTAEIYKSKILNSKTPWVISFVKKTKTDKKFVHSE